MASRRQRQHQAGSPAAADDGDDGAVDLDQRDNLLKEIQEMDVYENMSWPSDVQFLQFYDTAAAPFGGPIALAPKHPRPSSIDPFLRIFNACGVEITRFNWYDDHVKALGWSNDEDLFCVLRDGRVMQYDTHGQARVFYNIFDQDESEDAVDVAKVWPRGVAVITCMFRIFVFSDLSSASQGQAAHAVAFKSHPNTSMNKYATALGMIEGYCNRTGQAELVYALWDSRAHTSTLVVSTPDKAVEVPLENLYPPCPGDVNSVIDVTVHDDGKFVAIVTVGGSVTVFSADFAQTFVHIELRAVTPPVSAVWFGRQFQSHATLAVAWSQPPVLMLCDISAGVRWFPISSNFIAVPEIDGLRVVDKSRSFFLQRVSLSDAGQFLMKIYDSAVSNKFAGGAKSEQRNRVLAMLHDSGKLQQGVKELLQAAAARFAHEDQEPFLKAAAFGKGFVNRYRTFDPLHFKTHAMEVQKELQQQALQPGFHQGGAARDAPSAFVDKMRLRAFEINKIFSEACKRIRLRNSLRTPASGAAGSAGGGGGGDDGGGGGKSSTGKRGGSNIGRVHRYGKELVKKKKGRGGGGGSSKSSGSAATLPCIPLTGKQHDALGEAAIIRRLVRRQNFEFAAQVCNFLSWSKESVLLHWSRAKILSLPPPPADRYQGTTELTQRDELVDSMLSHLERQGFRCYAHLALAAHQCRDDGLAERMLRMEQSLNQQLGASLLMGNCDNALREAVASGDEQLCLALLVHLKRHQYPHDEAAYMRLLDRVPRAHSYLLALRRQQSGDGAKLFHLLLRDPRADNPSIHGASGWEDESSPGGSTPGGSGAGAGVPSGNYREAGNLMLGLAAKCPNDPLARLKYLEKALDAFADKNAPADLAASAALVREAIGLAEIQVSKLPPNMAPLSMYDTVRELSARSDGGEELASSMKDLFRIDNGVYYRLKISGIAKDARWKDLEQLSQKGGVVKALAPDGLRVFVQECVAAGAPPEISAAFLDRIRDRRQRMNAAADVGDYELAAAIAMDLGDDAVVNMAMSKAGVRTNYQKQAFVEAARGRDPKGKSKFSR